MNTFIIIMIVIIVAFLIYKMCQSGDDNSALHTNMTDTQRNWHKYKNSTIENDHLSLYAQMYSYIVEHKRPFYILEWLLSSIDKRMVNSYIRNMALIVFILGVIPLFFGGSIVLPVISIWILVVDLHMYKKRLLLEITEWNPEFCERFLKNITVP